MPLYVLGGGGGASAGFAQSSTSAAFAQSATSAGFAQSAASASFASVLGAAGVEVTRAASQGITQNTDTAVTFTAAALDENDYWSSTGQPTRLSAQVTGWHWVYGTVEWGGSITGTTTASTSIRQGGSSFVMSTQFLPGANGRVPVGGPVYLSSSDYLEVIARHDGAVSYSIIYSLARLVR